jgi:hypothetical protein
MKSTFTTATILTALVSLPAIASAEPPTVLRAGTHPWFASFSLAPALSLSNSATQVKIGQGFGWHFLGDASGPALAIELQESFGGNVFAFQPGAKFLWDIQIVDDLGLYLTPSAMFGIAYASGSDAFGNSASAVGFDMQFGFEGKLVLGDRGFVFFRPFTLDVGIGASPVGNGTAIRYDLLFGGGITF